jgi:hypothetical protein
MTSLVRRLVALGFLGCALQPDSVRGDARLPATAAAFARTEFPRAGLAFDGLTNASTETLDWPVGGVLMQRGAITEDTTMSVTLRAAPDETLEGVERDHASGRFTGRRTATICGRPAVMQRVAHEGQSIDCVIVAGGDNHPARIPAREVVAVWFVHRSVPILVEVDIEADEPGRYAAWADHVLASIDCHP